MAALPQGFVMDGEQGSAPEPAATQPGNLPAGFILDKPRAGRLESFGRGTVEGATFGFDSKFGKDWHDAREASKKENPWTHFAGEVVGSAAPIAATGGAAALPGAAGRVGAAVGRALLPIGATGYGTAMRQGVRVGATLGGLSGAGHADVQDDDTTAQAVGKRLAGAGQGALIGGVVGGPVGGVAHAIGNGVSGAFNGAAQRLQALPEEVAQFNRGAVQRVARAAGADGAHTGNIRGHPEHIISDLGPNLRDQISALANQPGENNAIIVRALNNRREGAADRLTYDTDMALGPPMTLARQEAMIDGRNALARPHYEAFYNSEVPMTPPLAATLQRADAAGAFEAAHRLTSASRPPRSEAEFYDYVKRGIDDMATRARNAGSANEHRIYSQLAADLRNAVDESLSPGAPHMSPWAQARRFAGEASRFEDAVEAGHKTFSRGTHPEQFRADLADMSGIERLGTIVGARNQLRDTIGHAANAARQNGDIKTLQQLGSPYARDKLEQIALSPQRARDLTQRLDSEARYADTYYQTLLSARTASRLAAQEEFPNAASAARSPDLTHVTATGLAVHALRRIADTLRSGALSEEQIAISRDAARMLVAQGADRDRILRGLANYMQQQNVTAQQRAAAARIAEGLVSAAPASVVPEVLSGPRQQPGWGGRERSAR